MAYCEKCGAYIPDGQSKCLACGFDGVEEERRAAQAARQQEDQRAQAEQRRRERQEINKKWAESEQRRRERQEASKKWAENEQHRRNMEELERRRREAEEKARREAEQRQSTDWQQTEYGSFRFTDGNDRSRTSAGHNKLLAALSYVNILFLIPLLFVQDDEFARFHAKQGARLFVCYAIARILGAIFSIGWLVNILLVIMMILGIKNALNDKWEPLPYIGKFKLF